jgi:hypothetical protein
MMSWDQKSLMANLVALEDERLLRLAFLIGGQDGRAWAEGDGIEHGFNPAVGEALNLLLQLQNHIRRSADAVAVERQRCLTVAKTLIPGLLAKAERVDQSGGDSGSLRAEAASLAEVAEEIEKPEVT